MKMTVINNKRNQKMSLSTDDQSDFIEILKHLSTIHRDQFNNRRIAELQIIIPLLTFYVLTTYAIINDSISNMGNLFCMCILLIFIDSILAIISSLYLRKIHQKNQINKGIAETAENILIDLSRDESLKKSHKERESEGNWSLHWQIIFILLFALSSIMVLLTAIILQVITLNISIHIEVLNHISMVRTITL